MARSSFPPVPGADAPAFSTLYTAGVRLHGALSAQPELAARWAALVLHDAPDLRDTTGASALGCNGLEIMLRMIKACADDPRAPAVGVGAWLDLTTRQRGFRPFAAAYADAAATWAADLRALWAPFKGPDEASGAEGPFLASRGAAALAALVLFADVAVPWLMEHAPHLLEVVASDEPPPSGKA